MKKNNTCPDKSSVYRRFDYGKINAPAPFPAKQPKPTVISSKRDLRGGRK